MTINVGMSTRSGIPIAQGSGMGGGIVPGVFSQADSMRPTIYGERWAIVGGHPLVSEVGAEILRRGGNAIDAGVAAGFASNVVQVEMCNLGGIAPILYSIPVQLLAYHVAVLKGTDVDQPRNLAKSVTVE